MQITNTYQKYQSRSNQELENIISYVVHQFKQTKLQTSPRVFTFL